MNYEYGRIIIKQLMQNPECVQFRILENYLIC